MRFSLCNMMLFVALLAAVFWWFVVSRRCQVARDDYERSMAAYDAGSLGWPEVFQASERLRDAEAALALRGWHRPALAHVVRVQRFEIRLRSGVWEGPPGSRDEFIAPIRSYRESQEQLLRERW